MKAGKHQRDLLKLAEIRGLLQELQSSGLLNLLYHLVKKIRSRVTSYLSMQDHKPKVPVSESIKALFTLVVDDLFANETSEGAPRSSNFGGSKKSIGQRVQDETAKALKSLQEITEIQPSNFKMKYGRGVIETPNGYSKITTSRLKNATPFSSSKKTGAPYTKFKKPYVETKGFSEIATPSLIDSSTNDLDHSFNVFTPRERSRTPENGRSNSVGSKLAISSMANHRRKVSRDLNNDLQLITSPDRDLRFHEPAKTARLNSNPKLIEDEENYLKSIVEKIKQEVILRTKQLEQEDSFFMRSRKHTSNDFDSRRSSSFYNPQDSLISEARGAASFTRSKRDMQISQPVSPGPSSYYPRHEIEKRQNYTGSFYRETKDTGATLTLKNTYNGCRQKIDFTPGPGAYTPKYKYTLREGSRER